MPSRRRTGPGKRGLPADFSYGMPPWAKPMWFNGDADDGSSSYSDSSSEKSPDYNVKFMNIYEPFGCHDAAIQIWSRKMFP